MWRNGTGAALIAVLCLTCAAPALGCDRQALAKAIEAPLSRKADRTFDVGEIGSTDGGLWEIHFGPGGRSARSVQRTDYGETGRRVDRLTVLAPSAYAVSRTHAFYSAPYAVKGSKVVRQTREVLSIAMAASRRPPGSVRATPKLQGHGQDTLATFDAAEIRTFLPKLNRR